jgi:transcriptional regulator with XRE-family HTH domain
MASVLQAVAPPALEPSPLGAARARRRLTVEEAAARSGLGADEVRSLEEGRIYRFPSVADALAATLVYATALGISEREARKLAGLRGGRSSRSYRRIAAVLALIAAAALAGWLFVIPQVREAAAPAASPSGATESPAKLPPPWEIRVDVLNGTSTPGAATSLSNEIGGPLAYRMGTVGNAPRLDYVQTRVYYAPGSEAIAQRLADELGLEITELPSGKDPNRLLVIVGTEQPAS